MSRSISGATGFIQSYNYAGGLHLANQVVFGIWMHLFSSWPTRLYWLYLIFGRIWFLYVFRLHLATQDYSTCIRTERGYCSISYTQVELKQHSNQRIQITVQFKPNKSHHNQKQDLSPSPQVSSTDFGLSGTGTDPASVSSATGDNCNALDHVIIPQVGEDNILHQSLCFQAAQTVAIAVSIGSIDKSVQSFSFQLFLSDPSPIIGKAFH